MNTTVQLHRELEQLMRRLAGESSRPLMCSGTPLDCEVVEVGINPASDTPFWPFWNTTTGVDKEGWLKEYERRKGALGLTRKQIERFCAALAPVRCLELNLYHYPSPRAAELQKEQRKTELFDELLHVAQPLVLLVHGADPVEHLQALLKITLSAGEFVPATYRGAQFEVFAARKHFLHLRAPEVHSIAQLIKARVQQLKAARAPTSTTPRVYRRSK